MWLCEKLLTCSISLPPIVSRAHVNSFGGERFKNVIFHRSQLDPGSRNWPCRQNGFAYRKNKAVWFWPGNFSTKCWKPCEKPSTDGQDPFVHFFQFPTREHCGLPLTGELGPNFGTLCYIGNGLCYNVHIEHLVRCWQVLGHRRNFVLFSRVGWIGGLPIFGRGSGSISRNCVQRGIMFSTCPFVRLSVRSFIRLLPNCECYFLKTNEPIFIN